MSEEEWRPVVGFEELYEVSNLGRVRSLTRRVAFGRGSRIASGRLLAISRCSNGYSLVILTDGAYRRHKLVHRLVLEAFVGPCPPGMVACHYNGVRTDNALSNLRWDTISANAHDKKRHGTHVPVSKLTKECVERARDMARCGASYAEIGRWLGVAGATISDAVRRRTWSYCNVN